MAFHEGTFGRSLSLVPLCSVALPGAPLRQYGASDYFLTFDGFLGFTCIRLRAMPEVSFQNVADLISGCLWAIRCLMCADRLFSLFLT